MVNLTCLACHTRGAILHLYKGQGLGVYVGDSFCDMDCLIEYLKKIRKGWWKWRCGE